MFDNIHPNEWLTDQNLTDRGREVRAEYQRFADYVHLLDIPSFQKARTKYFMLRQNYWTQPDGFALPPHTINVCPNNLCNYKCHYCDFGQRESDTFYHQYNVIDNTKKIELPLDLCKSVVDQSMWFRPIIRASFREPMLWKGIMPYLEYTKQKGLDFWLLTNGYNLPKHAKDLVTLGLDSIRLSLDGPPAVHNDIAKVKDAYEKMIEGTNILIEERKKQNKKLEIGFYFTINDANYQVMYDTIEQLDRDGILPHVYFSFQWLLYTSADIAHAHNNSKDAEISGAKVTLSTVQSVDVNKMDIESMAEQQKRIAEKYPAEKGYRIHFRPSFDMADLKNYRDSSEFPVENPRCRTLWYNLNINPAGEVKSFHHCFLNATGNVHTSTLMDVWNNEIYRDQRAKLREHGAYKACTRCWGLYSLLEDKKRELTV